MIPASIGEASTLLNAAGAFLAGLASLATAVVSVRVTRKRERDRCDQRVSELQRTFRAGMRLADQRPVRKDDRDDEERWSHLP